MILDDLKFAWRSIRKNKLIAAVNVFGLSIGISACMLIFFIARYELGFDRFQPDRERIFRVYSQFPEPDGGLNRGVPTAVPITIRNNFTGIESMVNFHTRSFPVQVPQQGKEVKDFGMWEKTIITPPDYFTVFSYYEWMIGTPVQSLTDPFRVVLTESRARTYFGEGDLSEMIGREVNYQDSLVVTVSGIVKDIQDRTDFDFTDFISFSTVEQSWLRNHGIQPNTWNAINSSSQCFIKLAEGTEPEKIEAQILMIPEIYNAANGKWDDWRPSPKLQPLTDLHFNAKLGIFDNSRSVMDRSTLYILMGVALFLLIIAAINFVNLETARASRRAKEVGIRKALGGSRQKIIWRFLSECSILSLMAVMLSALWLSLALIYFFDVIPEGLNLDVFAPSVWTFMTLCFVAVTLLAGFYPAVVMSSFHPASALKNPSSTRASSGSATIRKGLTVFQFSFSHVFLAATFVVVLQLDYMVNKDLGFDPQAVVFLHTPREEDPQLRSLLKDQLAEIPQIESFGLHELAPIANVGFSNEFEYNNGKEILKHQVNMKEGDTTYLNVYGIKLLAGRNLLPVDSLHEILINETYMKLLGFEDPSDAVGATIAKRRAVVGVVRDFHTQSLHAGIRPTAITYDGNASGFGIRFFMREGKVRDLQPGLSRIEAAWNKVYPDYPFNPRFMNDTLKRYYENEQRTGKLAMLATGIALLISCLGLFGLSSFSVAQRTREIGIRKVFGASVNSIILLLSTDFMVVVGIALAIATPLAYLVADWWLRDFAYKVDLNAWIFVSSAMVSVATAFLTITVRTAGAAKADPVKSLRYE